MSRFDAWWLPAEVATDPKTLELGTLTCRYPRPTPALIQETVRSLRAAGRALTGRPVASIVEAVDAAAARLADRDDPIREQAETLVAAATGYAPEMATLVLDRMAADWGAARLNRLLELELGDPAVLDRFTPQGDRRVRAYGAPLAFHVFAGNVPGVAVTSMIRSLLVKTPVLGKLASGQPVLPVLFAHALDAVDPELASALAVTYWPGGSEDAEWRAFQAADLVVVYGGEEAVNALRERALPSDRLVIHGPRFSVGLVGRSALDLPETPQRIARAIAAFDQHGCVSPHALWVEDPGALRVDRFAGRLADALAQVENDLPRGRISAAEASTIQQERGAAELRGHASYTRVFKPDDTAWTVILDHEPAFRPSCLNRFVRVHPIDDLLEAPDFLAPVGHSLQSVALAGEDARLPQLADRLARIGATRITSFQRLPWPPPHWHHDGQGPLRELLHWVDLEDPDEKEPRT